MPDFNNAEYFLFRAKELAQDAKKIFENKDASADDLEKATRMKTEAFEYQQKHKNLTELDVIIDGKIADEKRKINEDETKKHDKLEADKAKNEFKSFGEFLHAVDQYQYKGKDDNRIVWYQDEKSGLESKDLAESAMSTGGALVPLQQLSQMYAASAPASIVRSRATIIPMSRRQVQIPVLDQTGTTAGTFHWFGGLQVYWQEEASSVTQSEPTFRQITLTANELVGYTRASEILLEDSATALEAFLTGPMGFAGAMSAAEDYAYFQGTGVGQPLGILNASGVLASVPRSVQSSVEYEDLLDMEASLYSPSNNAVWVISQSQMANVMKMTGPAGNPSYVYRPSAADGRPATLLGRPVIFSLDMLPAGSTTSAGDVMLADMSFYLIGDRKRVTVDSTRLERWRFNQVSWKVGMRVDGQPWLSAPITSRDGSTSVSPFVILGAKTT